MARNDHIHRIHSLSAEIAEQNAIIREIIAKAYAILKLPLPDTFLGRKTQVPFPKEDG